MFWVKRNQKSTPKEIRVLGLQFLSEQDGPPEQILKQRLISFFKRDRSVEKAFLSRVDYGDATPVGVALCLQTQFGTDKGMVEKIGMIFATVFGTQSHLDIIFLTDEQHASIAKVCTPFFS